MHLYCKTSVAILLVGVKDEHGVVRFPTSGVEGVVGLRIDVRPLVSINEQLGEAAAAALGESASVSLVLDIFQEFADETTLPDGTPATVYLASLDPRAQDRIKAKREWPSMPDILRGMSKDRKRLPYLRAWQILTGGLTLNTKAIEASDLKNAFDT